MFKTDLDKWYDRLPEHTRTWLKKQPVWHDSDLYKAFFFGMFIGVLVGVVL